MYKIIKDLSYNGGTSDNHATKSGWYIIENLYDGRYKISEYDEPTNTWSDDTTVRDEELIIYNKVLNTLYWAEETIPKVVEEKKAQLVNKICSLTDYTQYIGHDIQTAVDYYIQVYGFELFADELKAAGLAYAYIEDGYDPKYDMTDEQYELFKLLEDN